MERHWSRSQSVLGALIVLLALNVLAWGIIAYSGSDHASERQTWAHERTRLLDQQSSLEGNLTSLDEDLASRANATAILESEVDSRDSRIAELQNELDAQKIAVGDLQDIRLQVAAELNEAEKKKAALAEQLDDYRGKVNLARSELSGKTATLAARERDIAKAAKSLSLLGEAAEFQTAIEERKATASAELENYKRRINLARSELSGKTATLAARERDIAKAAKSLSLLGEAAEFEAAIEERKATASAELEDYKRRVNLARSELSGKTATLAARERDIAKAAKSLSLLGEAAEFQTAIEERKATASAELEDYKRRINLAMSGLSGRNATLEAREREIAKADEELGMLGAGIDAAKADLDQLNRAIAERSEAEDELATVQGQLTELRNEQATRLAVLGTLAGKIDRQRDLAETDEQALLSLRSTREAREDELGQVESSLAALRSERGEVQTMLAGLIQRRADEEAVKTDLEGLLKERDDVSTAIEAREQDLVALTERLAEREAVLKQSEQALSEKREEATALEARIEASEQRLSDIESTTLDYQRQATEAQQRLAADDQRIAGLQKQIATLNYEEEKVRVILTGLRARLDQQKEIELDIDGLRAKAEAARSEQDEQERLLTEKSKRVEEVDARLAELDNKREALERQLQTVTVELGVREAAASKLAQVETELAEKEATLASLGQEQATRLGLLGSLDAKLERQSSISDDFAQTEQRFAALMSDVDVATGDLAERQEALKNAEARLATLTGEIEQADGRVAKLDAEREVVEATLTERRSEIAELAKTADERTAELASAEQALTSVEEAKSKAETDLKELETKLASVDTDLAARIDEQTKATKEMQLSESQRRQLRAELEETRSRLEEASQANTQVAREAETLKASLDALNADVDAKQEEQETATDKLQSLQSDIETAKADLLTSEAALSDSRAELERLVRERRGLLDSIDKVRDDIAAVTTADGIDPLLAASPVQTEDGVRIAHLLFNYASSELSPGAQRKVAEAAGWIKDNQVKKIRLVGYADATGSPASNQVLSQARAERTADALAGYGIDAAAIEIEAVGDNVLVEATDAQVAEPLNRSVGIFVDE